MLLYAFKLEIFDNFACVSFVESNAIGNVRRIIRVTFHDTSQSHDIDIID